MKRHRLVVVIGDEESRRSYTDDLTRRFGSDYNMLAEAAPESALRRLEELRRDRVPARESDAPRAVLGVLREGSAALSARR